jgi:TolA-binding protein
MIHKTQNVWFRVLGLCVVLCLQPLTGMLQVHGQDDKGEAAMAAYADAANFQTGGATNLAIDGWQSFLSKYPKHPMAADAAHYLGVCYMQLETPDYIAAAKAFGRALQK